MALLFSAAFLVCAVLAPSAQGKKMRTSWYEMGHTTASGLPFNANDPSIAAHRTLPLHTMVRATNLKNGKQILLKIIDRGPKSEKLDLDVSRAAAERLDFIKQGIVTLKIEILPAVHYP